MSRGRELVAAPAGSDSETGPRTAYRDHPWSRRDGRTCSEPASSSGGLCVVAQHPLRDLELRGQEIGGLGCDASWQSAWPR